MNRPLRHLSPADFDFPEELQADPVPTFPILSGLLMAGILGAGIALGLSGYWS